VSTSLNRATALRSEFDPEMASCEVETGVLPAWHRDLARLRASKEAVRAAPEVSILSVFDCGVPACLRLAPSVRVIRLDWPVLNIDRDVERRGPFEPDTSYILITRNKADVRVTCVNQGMFAFFRALSVDGRVEEAASSARGQDRYFDLNQTLDIGLAACAFRGD